MTTTQFSPSTSPENYNGTAYVAGPMSGIKAANFPAFIAADHWLRDNGWSTFNPAVHELERGIVPEEILDMSEDFFTELAELGFEFDKSHALRRDMNAIADADSIILLEGWETSSGATLELRAAVWTNKNVHLLYKHTEGEYTLQTVDGPRLIELLGESHE